MCNDGVTIAKEFDLKDPEENLGAGVREPQKKPATRLAMAPTSTILPTIIDHAVAAVQPRRQSMKVTFGRRRR